MSKLNKNKKREKWQNKLKKRNRRIKHFEIDNKIYNKNKNKIKINHKVKHQLIQDHFQNHINKNIKNVQFFEFFYLINKLIK